MFLSPVAPENLVSRDGFGSSVSTGACHYYYWYSRHSFNSRYCAAIIIIGTVDIHSIRDTVQNVSEYENKEMYTFGDETVRVFVRKSTTTSSECCLNWYCFCTTVVSSPS